MLESLFNKVAGFLCWILFSIKLQASCVEVSFNTIEGLLAYKVIKKRLQHRKPATLLKSLQHRCFPVNITKFLITPFLTKHLRWLVLSEPEKKFQKTKVSEGVCKGNSGLKWVHTIVFTENLWTDASHFVNYPGTEEAVTHRYCIKEVFKSSDVFRTLSNFYDETFPDSFFKGAFRTLPKLCDWAFLRK